MDETPGHTTTITTITKEKIMAISVRLNSAVVDPIVHDDATKWTIEKDTRSLVLMTDRNDPVAVYGTDKWMSASVVSETHDHDTINLVHRALMNVGIQGDLATEAITSMPHFGILFRHRVQETDGTTE